MFKSGRSIHIAAPILANMNAIQVAPLINLHGLILKADQAIHPEIMSFLTSKGLIIQQIEEDGDKLIRISGTYRLDKNDVQEFLRKNPQFSSQVESKEEQESDAVNFQAQLKQMITNKRSFSNQSITNEILFLKQLSLRNNDEGQPEGNINLQSEDMKLLSLKTQGYFAGTDNNIKSGGNFKSKTTTYVSGNNTIIEAATNASISGSVYSSINLGISFGVLSEFMAGEDTTISAGKEISIIDTYIFTGKLIRITSLNNNVILGLSSGVAWHNAPSIPSLFSHFQPVKSLTFPAANEQQGNSKEFLMEKYKLKDASPESINQGFRRATRVGIKEHVLAFYRLGAQVDAQDDNKDKKYTALHIAFMQDHNPIIRLLHALGASTNIPDANGKIASDYAKVSNDEEKHEAHLPFNEQAQLLPSNQALAAAPDEGAQASLNVIGVAIPGEEIEGVPNEQNMASPKEGAGNLSDEEEAVSDDELPVSPGGAEAKDSSNQSLLISLNPSPFWLSPEAQRRGAYQKRIESQNQVSIQAKRAGL